MNTTEHVFYQPGQHWPWSYVYDSEAGQVDQCGKSLDELATRYPGMTIITEAECREKIEALTREAPVLIDAEAYDDALNMLPPMGWEHYEETASFRMSERLNGNITRIYVRIGMQYFRFAGHYATSHADAVATVRAAAPALLARSAS